MKVIAVIPARYASTRMLRTLEIVVVLQTGYLPSKNK